MKDKLKDLIISADIACFGTDKPYAEVYADYLLKHGVIVPPCNVGDTVYQIDRGEIKQRKVLDFTYDGTLYVRLKPYRSYEYLWGVDIFPTLKEAEDMLAKYIAVQSKK